MCIWGPGMLQVHSQVVLTRRCVSFFLLSCPKGMTKNGKQPTPEIVQKMLGVEIPKMEGEGKTLADLLGPEATQE